MSKAINAPDYDAIKPRIFLIGFNKCATRTIYSFLKLNDIKSVHFKRGELARVMAENQEAGVPTLKGIDRWVGYTDIQQVKNSGAIEACEYYQSLAAYYPRSYFVLNTRNKDKWIQSRLKHGDNQKYADRYRKALGLNTIDETVSAWSELWDKHHAEVPAFFAETGQNFIVYDIDNDTPDKLSDFLAPDFETDPSLFGHEGKTDPKAPSNPISSAPARPVVQEAAVAKPKKPAKADKPVAVKKKLDEPEVGQLGAKLRPRNDIVNFDETATLPAYESVAHTSPKEGSTGNVIVACMKNEGPFLLEWIAYHRAIGFHHFLIYTNDCTDGTDVLLDQLAETGLVTHVDNNNWKGNSPQVAALNAAMKHPVVKQADWLVHVDADEFINIRTGNGTFECLLNALPDDVTNIAMTWRMFGSAGVQSYQDVPVLEQFDQCAPAFIPKPHTAWGFKTATRNIGAYAKISCHRPNGLDEGFEDKIKWVNGSGDDITKARAQNGWRSDIKIIGYDLVQLNHYALRSSDSFLVKRQRGRALHVDRSIGQSYWMRMDWNTYRDVTISRNLPRMKAELENLKSDAKVAKIHGETVAWHVAKITELKETPEFLELLNSIHDITLDDTARIVKVLAEGVET